MGSLTVTFSGICTHIPADAIRPLGGPIPNDVQWRVVFVTGLNGLAHLDPTTNEQKAIPPHDASLKFGTNAISGTTGPLRGLRLITPSSCLLRGVRLTVANPVVSSGTQPITLNNWDIVPSLHHFAAKRPATETSLELAKAVVDGQSAAGFFDITTGQLTASYLGAPDRHVAFVDYTVETDGPPALRAQAFFDGSEGTVHFQHDNVSIEIDNTGETKDTWWDFMLHYLVCTEIPPNAFPPGPANPSEDDGLTAGCSNSSWP